MGKGIHVAGTIPSMALGAYSTNKNRTKVKFGNLKTAYNLLNISEKEKIMSPEQVIKNMDALYIDHLRQEKEKKNKTVYTIVKPN